MTRDLVSYRVTLLDEFGKPFSGERRVLSESPEFPVKLPGSAAFEYMVVRIERRKSPDQVPPVEVHLHSDGSVMRVVGLRH